MAMDVAQIAAWEWDVDDRADDMVDGSGGVVRVPGRLVRARPARSARPSIRDDRARVDAAFVGGASRSGAAYECEYRVLRPDGCGLDDRARPGAAARDDGNVEKMVGVSRDVSAQRRAEQERERCW